MELIIKEQREDMEWMGLNPYYWKKQSDIIDEAQEWIGKRLTLLPDDALPATPGIIGGEGLVLYPLTATLTAEKVVMDWMDGINMLIRGLDLITEYSLYQYYCRVFELPEPKHIYLPRLKWMHGEMSKSAGSQTVCELRSSGYAPRQVKDRLETACLILPINGWTLDNLKGSPRW
jgi:glutamyl/glutaminyl-tRNA synthetase